MRAQLLDAVFCNEQQVCRSQESSAYSCTDGSSGFAPAAAGKIEARQLQTKSSGQYRSKNGARFGREMRREVQLATDDLFVHDVQILVVKRWLSTQAKSVKEQRCIRRSPTQ